MSICPTNIISNVFIGFIAFIMLKGQQAKQLDISCFLLTDNILATHLT